ncbi:hypothetical protein PVK06_005787 [Gossypium arboreum]|uniref:Uncharacterized protein n=1 Tax=Gossypium arboreum TaxID=29729 RepID=A0ABR0QWH6_GOSAR|nr:hypothetical protein PVK06_005787 [Gossypium arboreum]
MSAPIPSLCGPQSLADQQHAESKEHEVEDEKKASLSQIKWFETNLQNTLQEIKDRKAKLLNDSNTSIRKARAQRSVGRQTPLAYNGTTGNRVLNRGSQNLNSSRLMQQHDLRTCPFSSMAHTVLLDHLYQSRGVSAGYRGASSSSGFNPLAAGAGLTQHAATPPAYPQIQIHPGIRNSQNGMSGNSNQPIMGDPAIPFAPSQAVEALGAPNMCQPMLHGIMDQQQELGGLGSSSTGQPANNVLSRGQANQMPAIQNVNPQNGVSPVLLTS